MQPGREQGPKQVSCVHKGIPGSWLQINTAQTVKGIWEVSNQMEEPSFQKMTINEKFKIKKKLGGQKTTIWQKRSFNIGFSKVTLLKGYKGEWQNINKHIKNNVSRQNI